MPLDRVSFTSVLSSCHDIQTAFPPIQKYMVFWKHFLVASSWNDSQDSFTLYDYLTHPDTGKCDDGLINQVKEKAQVCCKDFVKMNAKRCMANKPVIKTKSLSWKKRSKSKTSGEQQQAFTGFLAPDIQLNRGVKEKIVNLNDGGKHSMIIYQVCLSCFVLVLYSHTQPKS